jgi:membrane protein implicated in regulation of membrane protease activity
MEFYQISIILGIVCLITEMLTFTFIFLGVGVAFFSVSTAQYFFDGLSINRDILIFAIVSFAAILMARGLFKKKLDQKTANENDINQY